MHGQEMLINLNFAHPQVTSSFVRKNPVLNLSRWPSYTLRTSGEVTNLVNQKSYKSDYYPYKVNNKINDVINNHVNSHNYNFKRIGYNCFSFKLPQFEKRVILPLLIYHHENLTLHLNHHLHKLSNKNGLIEISNVHSGNNQIKLSDGKLFFNRFIQFG